MKVRAIAPFFDRAAQTDRNVGDVWEADEDRLSAITGAGHGTLAEAVDPPKPARKPARASRKGLGRGAPR